MPLSRHLEQGRLLYLTRNPDAILVSENDHFRWLSFDNVIQSVMKKRAPNRLTLPHQYALLLPLGYFNPTHIIEFGLGGGNISRFITASFPQIEHKVVEQNKAVIYCFDKFFSPENNPLNLNYCNAENWLSRQESLFERTKATSKEWFIYDIYQHQDEQLPASNYTLYQLVEKLNDTQLLSINLPFIERHELNHVLKKLKMKHTTHTIALYRVPQYRNKVIHLIPNHCRNVQASENILPLGYKKYWVKYDELFREPITN